jgi:hypothetical protein
MDHSRHRDFKELCHKEGKSFNQGINELVDEKLELNAIGENTPGESISCLGYTPKPVQQKITDNIDTEQGRFNIRNYPTQYDWKVRLSKMDDSVQVAEIICYGREIMKAGEYRLDKINDANYLNKSGIRRRPI